MAYSYLLLPLALIITKAKKKEIILVGIYGTLFFFFLHYDYKIIDLITVRLFTSLYTSVEYSIFTYLIWSNIKSPKLRIIIIVSSIFFAVFQCIYYFIAKKWRLDTIPIGIETILVFIYIFFFFFEYFKSIQNQYVYNDPVFWVAVGILIYLGSSFFFNILGNYIDQKEQSLWFVTYIAEILKNIFLVVAIFLYARRPNEDTKKNLPYLDLDFSLTDQQHY